MTNGSNLCQDSINGRPHCLDLRPRQATISNARRSEDSATDDDGGIVRAVAMDEIPRANWIEAFSSAWAGYLYLHFIKKPLWQRS